MQAYTHWQLNYNQVGLTKPKKIDSSSLSSHLFSPLFPLLPTYCIPWVVLSLINIVLVAALVSRGMQEAMIELKLLRLVNERNAHGYSHQRYQVTLHLHS